MEFVGKLWDSVDGTVIGYSANWLIVICYIYRCHYVTETKVRDRFQKRSLLFEFCSDQYSHEMNCLSGKTIDGWVLELEIKRSNILSVYKGMSFILLLIV